MGDRVASYEEILMDYLDQLFCCAFLSLPEPAQEEWKGRLVFLDPALRQISGFMEGRAEGHPEEGAGEPTGNFGNQERAAYLKDVKQKYQKGIMKLMEQEQFVPMAYLLETFSLQDFERHLIRTLYGCAIQPSYAGLAPVFGGDLGENGISPELAAATFAGEISRKELLYAFREEGALVRFLLKKDGGNRYDMARTVRLSDRVLSFLSGELLPGRQRFSFGTFSLADEPLCAWEGRRGWIDFLKKLLEKNEEQRRAAQKSVVYLYGNEGSGRKLAVKTALKEMGRDGLFLEGAALYACCGRFDSPYGMPGSDGFLAMTDAILFELKLLHMVPVLLLPEGYWEEGPELREKKIFAEQLANVLLEASPVLAVCAAEKASLSVSGNLYYLPEEKMTFLESCSFWEQKKAAYGCREDFNCDWMAGKFSLTRGQIEYAFAQAERQAYVHGNARALSMEAVTAECYAVIHHKMGKKARRVEARYQMEDLILPERQKKKLSEAIDQIRYRRMIYGQWGFEQTMSYGRGVSVAFVGAPGTGKTMAAQVIANALSMELYKVELSSVVSKYIGETEKNLEEIFAQAEKSQVILLFDEADALFSKRSEGKDANDKYSNMEASFLLQKMEAYDGITILATNLFHHFDEAYKRRLKIVVDFPVPQEEDRKRLWQSMLPKKAPCGEIDFDFLASRFELTGSNIRNILLHAAFLAAAKEKPLDMEEIIPAIANEYGKNGKVLSKEEVLEYYLYLE